MKQADLFTAVKDPPESMIPGLSRVSRYISPEQERSLLSNVDRYNWLPDLKRRVQHYGYKYDYKARAVGAQAYLGPMPAWASGLCRGLAKDGVFPVMPDQVIVNEYLPGQGISAHVDCVPCFGDPVASLSLGAHCVMEFSKPGTGEKREVSLEPQSLIVLSGPARYAWRHAIPARKSDMIGGVKILRERRVSLTFRKVIL